MVRRSLRHRFLYGRLSSSLAGFREDIQLKLSGWRYLGRSAKAEDKDVEYPGQESDNFSPDKQVFGIPILEH